MHELSCCKPISERGVCQGVKKTHKKTSLGASQEHQLNLLLEEKETLTLKPFSRSCCNANYVAPSSSRYSTNKDQDREI